MAAPGNIPIQGVVLLREGTDTSQGKAQLISNINACSAIVDTVRTTLGPRGQDKLLVQGGTVTISNDGATIMRLLDVVHPAAQVLVQIAQSQDEEVGDGTTSVVVLAGELLKEAKGFIEDGLHPSIVMAGLRQATLLAKKFIHELEVDLSTKPAEERRALLQRCAETALNSKLIGTHREFFGKMAVDAVMHLDPTLLDLKMVGIKKECGGALEDSELIDGVCFKKLFQYAGFEQQPKQFDNPKVLCLNVELELKAEAHNAEVQIKPSDFQAIVDAEWQVIYDKMQKIVDTGAQIVFSKAPVGDLAQQYMADRGIFCGGRCPEEDLKRVAAATGAKIQSSVHNLVPEVLGTCHRFEERQVGAERYNYLIGCPGARSVTIMLRGGGSQFLDEADRSLHDSICVARRALKHQTVVAGGGAIEMELRRMLIEHARTISGKQQLIIEAFARALEVIPRQIATNAGFDSTDLLNQLRQKHSQPDGKWYGIDLETEGVTDTFKSFVLEPSLIKLNSITAASEAACLLLSVDETVRNPSTAGGMGDDQLAPKPRGGRR